METVHSYGKSEHARRTTGETTTLWLCYVAYLLIVTAPLGFLAVLWKLRQYRRQAPAETFITSHYIWLMRTFLITLLLIPVSIGTSYYMWGFVIGAITIVWYVYRVVRGMLLTSRREPAPVA